MTSRRKIRTLGVLVAAISLALAACGSRLDHDVIVASGSGVGAGSAGSGLPGGDTVPGEIGPGDTGPGDTGLGDTGPGGTKPGSTGPGGTGPGGTRPGSTGPGGVAGSPANGAPIVVGAVGTYSGAAGVATKPGATALRVWAADTNARGGINGRPVKAIIYDDGGDTAKARSLVQRLVEQDKAVAMLNADTVGRASFAPYVQQKRFPVIGSCWSEANSRPMFFSACAKFEDSVYLHALTGAKYGKGKKFGVLSCVESADCTRAADMLMKQGYAKKAGLDPVYRADASIAKPDFTAECIQARNAGVQLFSVFLDANSVERVVESCRRQGFNPQYLQTDTVSQPDFPTIPGLTDVLVSTQVFPYAGLTTPAFKEFEAAWKKYAGGEAQSGTTAITWAAGKMFEAAAKKAGNDLSRESLIKALYSFSGQTFGGLTVPLTFTPQGSRPASCGFFMRAANGGWVANAKPLCA